MYRCIFGACEFSLMHALIILFVHMTIVLSIVLFSCFGYYFNKHLLAYLLTYLQWVSSARRLFNSNNLFGFSGLGGGMRFTECHSS